jgi:hypothetical protein
LNNSGKYESVNDKKLNNSSVLSNKSLSKSINENYKYLSYDEL